MNKAYLGDAVYAEIDDATGEVWLTTSNGLRDTNQILLEDGVLVNLFEYLLRYRREFMRLEMERLAPELEE